MILLRIFCWLRETWLTIDSGLPISGHDFAEVKNKDGIQVLRCRLCGYKSRAFNKGNRY